MNFVLIMKHLLIRNKCYWRTLQSKARMISSPAKATGSDAEVMSEFRKIRVEIQNQFQQFYNEQIKLKEN